MDQLIRFFLAGATVDVQERLVAKYKFEDDPMIFMPKREVEMIDLCDNVLFQLGFDYKDWPGFDPRNWDIQIDRSAA